uniref:isomerizing glutamine--fructose-6-phosphate transaminase n=1 Tax=Vallitalea guaymasensis TaxID=1185412 RepID=UPI00272CF7D0
MCGIVGYIGDKEAAPILIDGLKSLEYRGYDSAGVSIYDHKIKCVKTKGRLINLEERLNNNMLHGNLGIGHTRWATHGEPSDINSHPHMNSTNTISLVHNGIIENYMTIKEKLESKGQKFVSETDTEVAVQLIDYYYSENHNLLDAVLKAMDKIEGSYAFGVICNDEPDKIIAVRKDSPLIIGIGKGENYIASDIPAILEHTRDVYLLEDKEIAIVTKDNVKIIDTDKNEVTREIYNVTWDLKAARKEGFDHFMLKEIFEQPRVVKDTLTPR